MQTGSSIYCIKKPHLSDKDRYYLRVKGWKKKVFKVNSPKKLDGVTILIFNKIEFQPKVIKMFFIGSKVFWAVKEMLDFL